MFLLLAALFIGLPVLEIWLLISVGGSIGLLPTLAVCVVTGVVGAWLAKAQGGSVLRRVQERVARGEVPASELVDGMMILVAGVLLMTPGFLTDGVGVLLLLPPVRMVVRRWGQGLLERQARASQSRAQSFYFYTQGFGEPPREPQRRPEPDRQNQPEVEFLPPERAPRPPRRPRPPVIDVD
ncbi:MAG: FxsA family protein [Deltaproteobacteria bacterium]|nr:MAG: FxsA family protein [Deltaproteobacteria bacterium]